MILYSLCHKGFLSYFPILMALMSGAYGLYLITGIRAAANGLQKDTNRHFFWFEYGRLFPDSHKRLYCVICLLLFFIIPPLFGVFCVLMTGEF
jgi:hypothetical protein